MKRLTWAMVLGAWILSLGWAQADEVRIGYVDLRKVVTESKAGQRVKGEIEKTVKERRESLAHEEQQLKTLQQNYEKEKLLLSETQRQAKQKEFDEKLRAYQQSTAEAQREIERRETEFTRKALPQIRAIIRAVAKEQNLTLVFEKNEMPVLYAADGPDLTDKVIQRFDAKGGSIQ